jgi:hypothetical protein
VDTQHQVLEQRPWDIFASNFRHQEPA